MTGAARDIYAASGVDIDAGHDVVERIATHLSRTARPEVVTLAGGFAGGFALDTARYPNPVLVAGTDGVGTKVLLAARTGRWRGIGIDAVAMSVNDVVVTGAEPLLFLDYLATGQLDPAAAEQVVAGIADGCAQAGCALVGGETAEMPGMYAPGDLDVAGFCVGALERGSDLGPHRVRPGDALVGLASSGVHANGFSLVRRLLVEHDVALDDAFPGATRTVADALLEPTRIYVRTLLDLAADLPLAAAAHITGGGLVDNVPRVLPDGFGAAIDTTAWRVPAVHEWLAHLADAPASDLYRVLNMGIGMVLVVPRAAVDEVVDRAQQAGEEACVIGEVTPASRGVELIGLDRPHRREPRHAVRPTPSGRASAAASQASASAPHGSAPAPRTRVAIVASGTGTNAQALVDAVEVGRLDVDIACIASDRPGAPVTQRARRHGIDLVEVDPAEHADRDAYERALVGELTARDVDLVVLAGYMRICGPVFLDAFEGRTVNLHPSLLPAFPGRDAIGDALAAGVRMTGVTVHYIDAGVDTGPIVAQAAVPVDPGDSRDTLAARVHEAEHALLVATVADLAARHRQPHTTTRDHTSTLEAAPA